MFQNNLLMAAASTAAGVYTVEDSVRYNDDDSPRLERTPSAPGNRMTGSISLWYKRGNLGSIMQLFNAGAGDDITFNASDQLTFIDSSGVSYITTQVFRDPAAWGHLLFAWDTRLASAGDRLRIYHNGTEITDFATETNPSQYDQFEISNTVVQTIGANESDTEEFDGYLSQLYYVDGQQLTPTAFGEFDDNGVWRPIEFVTATVGTFGGDLTKPNSGVTTSASAGGSTDSAIDGNTGTYWSQGASATPAGAWWQIVFGSAVAIRQITLAALAGNNAGDDIDIESYDGSSWTVVQNITPVKNAAVQVFAVADSTARTTWRLVLKNALSAPYSWTIEELTMFAAGTSVYGTNGIFLDFADSSDFGNDVSGNNNDYTSSGLAANDQMTDTPTTNFCTLSSIDFSSNVSLSDGNLVGTFTSSWYNGKLTFGVPPSGKWSFQITGSSVYLFAGVIFGSDDYTDVDTNGTDALYYYGGAGIIATYRTGSYVQQTGLNEPTADESMEFLIDKDNDQIGIVIDDTVEMGTDSGLEIQDTMTKIFIQGLNNTLTVDFGQGGYVPSQSGYKALSTANLPTPTILDGTANFQTTLYTGDGSTRNIDQTENSTFQPDMVWIKNRSQADPHMLIDAARGVTKELNPEDVRVESTDANGLTSFDSDGFGLGSGAGGYNDNTESFVAWQWLAGGGAGSSNDDGALATTTTTVNTTSGISISTYTGGGSATTIGHGLGVAPQFIIQKKRTDDIASWHVYHEKIATSDPADWYITLAASSVAVNHSGTWADTVPTSTVISLGSDDDMVGSSDTFVIYSFVGIEGYSKFSNYIGNGLADGPVAITGFKPAWVMIKRTTTTNGDWIIYDNTRSPYNEIDDQLVANDATAETTGSEEVDFLSNGFKIRTADGGVNASGSNYIYAAFAQYPFGGEDVTPATTF